MTFTFPRTGFYIPLQSLSFPLTTNLITLLSSSSSLSLVYFIFSTALPRGILCFIFFVHRLTLLHLISYIHHTQPGHLQLLPLCFQPALSWQLLALHHQHWWYPNSSYRRSSKLDIYSCHQPCMRGSSFLRLSVTLPPSRDEPWRLHWFPLSQPIWLSPLSSATRLRQASGQGHDHCYHFLKLIAITTHPGCSQLQQKTNQPRKVSYIDHSPVTSTARQPQGHGSWNVSRLEFDRELSCAKATTAEERQRWCKSAGRQLNHNIDLLVFGALHCELSLHEGTFAWHLLVQYTDGLKYLFKYIYRSSVPNFILK